MTGPRDERRETTHDTDEIDRLLQRSSLGDRGASRLRERTPVKEVSMITSWVKQIDSVPALTPAQERELAERHKEGRLADERLARAGGKMSAAELATHKRMAEDGQHAKQRLLEANLRLVVPIARSYEGQGVPVMDLIEAGNLGLIRATENFDHTTGESLSTYALSWIRREITRAVEHGGASDAS